MRFRFAYLYVILFLLSPQIEVSGQTSFAKPAEIENAALVYWQCFSLLPELDDEQRKLLDNIDIDNVESLNDQVMEIATRSQPCFELVQHIKPNTKCHWELIENGPSTHLPHLGKARMLAKLLIVAGHIEMFMGNQDAAVQRFSQALLVGRNVDDGALVPLLVGQRIEKNVREAISIHFGRLKAPSAKTLVENISQLPARETLADALKTEWRMSEDWLRNVLLSNDEMAREKLKAVFPGKGYVDAILSGSKKDRERNCEELGRFYLQFIAIAEGGTDRMQEKLDALDHDIRQARNLLGPGILPPSSVFVPHQESLNKWQHFEETLRTAAKDRR